MSQGRYYYSPHRNMWGVYRYDNETRTCGTFIKDYQTKEKAEAEVYRLNGWKPKNK